MSTRLARRAWIAVGIAAILLAACSAGTPQADEQNELNPDPWAVVEVANARYLPILASQDLAVGVKRIAFSLDGLRADDTTPTVRVSLFALDIDPNTPTAVQYARFIPFDADIRIAAHNHANATVSDRSLPISRGVYVVPVQLGEPGQWGMLLEIQDADSGNSAESEAVRLRFSVRERQAAPSVGDAAPRVASRTRDDVATLDELSSDPNPEPGLYARSIDEALADAQPLLLTFATPAYCHSRTCAPVLDAVKAVWRQFSDELIGIHVEVFENPQQPSRLVEAQAFIDWRLPSEPWVYVIDAKGIIRYAFEGAVTETELRSAVQWVIQDGQ